ncbi:MAG: PilZ domain-containing protein [Candidatus Methylomirabilales bacterium]
MSDSTDKRHSPRVPCDIPMEYEVEGARPQDGRITNIGTEGAFITTQETIPVGTKLILRFQLPLSSRPIWTVCTVKWADQRTVGVEFAGLNLWEQQEIWKYYAKQSARQEDPGA